MTDIVTTKTFTNQTTTETDVMIYANTTGPFNFTKNGKVCIVCHNRISHAKVKVKIVKT